MATIVPVESSRFYLELLFQTSRMLAEYHSLDFIFEIKKLKIST